MTAVGLVAGVATCSLAFLVTFAGAIKVFRPRYAAASLRRVAARASGRSPSQLLLAAGAIGVLEVVVGTLVPITTGAFGVCLAVALAALYLAFAGFTALAVRRGAACGCWGSLSDGTAGRAELGRRCVLAGVATACLGVRLIAGFEALLPLPWGVALAAIAVGAGVASQALPPTWRRTVDVAGFGVRTNADRPRPRNLATRERQALLASLRAHPSTAALAAALEPTQHLDWSAAIAVRSPEAYGTTLVRVPGSDITLRIIVRGEEPVAVIASTSTALLTVVDGVVHSRPKVARDASAATP